MNFRSFRGSGKGSPVGFPIEAVVQDLCDSRTALAKAMVSMNDTKDSVETMRTEVVDRLDTLITAVNALVTEIQQSRTEGAAIRTAAQEVKDALDRNTGARP